jgi:AAA domain
MTNKSRPAMTPPREVPGTFDEINKPIKPVNEPNIPFNGGGTASETNGPATAALSIKEIATMKFKPIKYVVPGIIVEGLTLLCAKPKVGKSWLLLHAAIAVARGGFTLGNIHCPQGDVLCCALEDSMRRVQSRLTKLLGMPPWPGEDHMHVRCEMPRLGAGGLDVIKDWITKAKNPRLVVIDTLAMIRAPKKRDQGIYEADYDSVVALRAFAAEHGVAIVLVHHLRKQDSDDAFDTVNATLGLTGAVDTVLIIKRDARGDFILHGRGRDLPEIEKAMIFNTNTCTWAITGEAAAVRISTERRRIIQAMKDIGAPAGPKDIAAIAELKTENVKAAEKIVIRNSHGKYGLPPQPIGEQAA